MKDTYPIKPKHLCTSAEPAGFDLLLSYQQRILLWSFVQYWQYMGEWKEFTLREFLSFMDSKESDPILNKSIRSGVAFFVESPLCGLLESVGEKGNLTFKPTHFMVSTYFQWNPNTMMPCA